jgi:hypothetical protein
MLILDKDGWDQEHDIKFSENQLKYERVDESTVILTNGTTLKYSLQSEAKYSMYMQL